MGYYINPPRTIATSAEDFLLSHGIEVPREEFTFKDRLERTVPIVLIYNGTFDAAGICYSLKEFEELTDILDKRPKRFFYIEVSDLEEVSNIPYEMIEGV